MSSWAALLEEAISYSFHNVSTAQLRGIALCIAASDDLCSWDDGDLLGINAS